MRLWEIIKLADEGKLKEGDQFKAINIPFDMIIEFDGCDSLVYASIFSNTTDRKTVTLCDGEINAEYIKVEIDYKESNNTVNKNNIIMKNKKWLERFRNNEFVVEFKSKEEIKPFLLYLKNNNFIFNDGREITENDIKELIETFIWDEQHHNDNICIENDLDGLCIENTFWYKSTGQKILTL